jgi:hypothetical protein
LLTAKSSYKASLDYLLCDLLLKEAFKEEKPALRIAKIEEAIAAFSQKVEQYRGTSMEGDMLARIATIYGSVLNDRAQAKEYADRAATINPGQESLFDAYFSAGIEYYPTQYADRFKDVAETFDTPPDQPKPVSAIEYVTVSPNPANPVTTITYSIKSPSNVRLSIYSINGQKVATLADGPMSAGTHSVSFDGSKYASGVYFYRFESAGLKKSGKMLLLK